MNTVSFWVTIQGGLSEEDGQRLWKKIQRGKEVNLTILFDVAYVYGKTTDRVAEQVILQCKNLGRQIQFDIS